MDPMEMLRNLVAALQRREGTQQASIPTATQPAPRQGAPIGAEPGWEQIANQPSLTPAPPQPQPEYRGPLTPTPEVTETRSQINELFPEFVPQGFKTPTGGAAERWVPQSWTPPAQEQGITPMSEVLGNIPASAARQELLQMLEGMEPAGLERLGVGDVYAAPEVYSNETMRRALRELLELKARGAAGAEQVPM